MGDAIVSNGGRKKTLANLAGKRFSRWMVLRQSPSTNANTRWYCRCDCGVEKSVLAKNLVSGESLSCGCLRRDAVFLHGLSATSVYKIYKSMISRCCNSDNKSYGRYGARGISVCDRWRESFESFLVDMGERPSLKHSIDRINNDLGYSPENCRWATAHEQGQNMRSTKLTAGAVRDIREMSKNGATLASIASIYPVHLETIRRVVKRKRWANV